jgi:[acyl-carrier-protein] S-malonyltransferase
MKAAWLFPGQGAQYPGMGRELCDRYPPARGIFAEAEALSGLPLRQIGLRGPDARLRQCDVLEPLLTATSVAYASFLRDQGLEPGSVAGYSAGEVAALFCAGVLTLTDALKVAVLRGRVLHEASQALPGRMVAVYGVPAAAVEEVVRFLRPRGPIAVGAWNAPEHTTVVGHPAVVGEAERLALALGAELSVIDVAGPWHCELAAAAAGRVARLLEEVRFGPPRLPVYTSATGGTESEPGRLRECLAVQICQPVLWQPIVADLYRQGVRQFLEAGPGRFLYSLMRRSGLDAAAYVAAFVERENGKAVALPKILAALCADGAGLA